MKLIDLNIGVLIPIVWTGLESPTIWTKKCRCERTLNPLIQRGGIGGWDGGGTARLQSLAKGEPFGLFTKFQKEVLEGNF